MRDKFDDDDEDNFLDRRGWSMKCGHCKRLLQPKRGKAAIRAEIQGQGKEVIRGRNAFSRTIGHRGGRRRGSPDWRGKYGADYPISKRRTKLRKLATADAREVSYSFQSHSLAKAIDDFMTGAENPAIEPDEIPCWNELFKEGVENDLPKPWELAIARAEAAAFLYELLLKEKRDPIPQPSSNRQKKSLARVKRVKKQKKLKTRPFDESDLWRFHKTNVSWSREQLAEKKLDTDAAAFQRFRKDFLNKHGMQICAGLHSCFQCPVQLEPTPLDVAIERRFLECISERVDGTWCPAFHGTSNKNLSSIYKRGLLIPGVGNDLRVSHGSAHGLGIYAATASNPFLSWGFCEERYSGNASMLVCAVLDDSSNTAESSFLGRFPVRSQSANIKRVGGAFVVFEPTRIAPLFVASRYIAPARETSHANDKELCDKVGPCSNIGKSGRVNGRAADIYRRRLIAICGHSVALSARAKARKKGADLLFTRRVQYMKKG